MRCVIIVLDSVGVGAMPDAESWGDAGTDTLGHVASAVGGLHLPHLSAMGLGNVHPVSGVVPVGTPLASWGRMATRSAGKDTLTGHWEIAGCLVDRPFSYYTEGFPEEIVSRFQQAIGREVLGNRHASGTVIIQELGEEHRRSGLPILYTSADSVFQLAAHEDVIPLQQLYRWCEQAYEIVSEYRVARVIARPFVGEAGAYRRTENRHDYAMAPEGVTVMDRLLEQGIPCTAVGKVENIYGGRGFSRSIKAGNNRSITDATLQVLAEQDQGLIFSNLVDFDMLYGHRRDPRGYGEALEEFDRRLPEILELLADDDLLILTADHGNDPTHTGTDHTREYVPLLAFRRDSAAVPLGLRSQLADVGASVAQALGVGPMPIGESFFSALVGASARSGGCS